MGSQTNAPLPDGTEIGGYRILRKIASGGFSIVYLAADPDGNRYAIKEYLPAALVRRAAGELAPSIALETEASYRIGLKCFFEEGRALASVLHPNVVRVVNFFRANETVYLVMAHEEGQTLQARIQRRRGKGERPVLDEDEIREVFGQVLSGLRKVHAARLLHLDLKPANVYLRADGSPMLLDFGAARRQLGQDAPRLFPMYTPGFAAPELLRKGAPLGPWTDIYGVGACLLACMTGAPPPPVDQRDSADAVGDLLPRLRESYSQRLVDLADWCLRLDPVDRPQSVLVVQQELRNARHRAGAAGDARGRRISRWLDTLAGRRGGDRR